MQPNRHFIVIVLIVGAGLFIQAAFLGNTGQEQAPSVIRAQKIELVDAAGKVRASLKIEESGETVFRLMDENGSIRVKLGASEDGSGLVLLDNETNPGIHALAKKQGITLTLSDGDGKKRLITP